MAKGKVAQVIGTVVDIEFPPDELPALFNAIEIETGGGKVFVDSPCVKRSPANAKKKIEGKDSTRVPNSSKEYIQGMVDNRRTAFPSVEKKSVTQSILYHCMLFLILN